MLFILVVEKQWHILISFTFRHSVLTDLWLLLFLHIYSRAFSSNRLQIELRMCIEKIFNLLLLLWSFFMNKEPNKTTTKEHTLNDEETSFLQRKQSNRVGSMFPFFALFLPFLKQSHGWLQNVLSSSVKRLDTVNWICNVIISAKFKWKQYFDSKVVNVEDYLSLYHGYLFYFSVGGAIKHVTLRQIPISTPRDLSWTIQSYNSVYSYSITLSKSH